VDFALKETAALIDGLQFLARLEANGLAGRDGNFGASARIAADASFARPNVEDAEAPQLDALAVSEGILHAIENSFDRQFGFSLGDAGSGDHFVDNVELNQGRLQTGRLDNASSD
jgi:hypothetical protein